MTHRIFLVLFLICSSFFLHGQELQEEESLKVFMDCRIRGGCDFNYFHPKVPCSNYVRDQGLADVHVLVNSIGVGSGGRKYTLQFIDQGVFTEAPVREIAFDATANATVDDVREQLLNKTTLGLVPYLMNTPARDQLTIQTPSSSKTEDLSIESEAKTKFDPWNFWVFETGFDIDADYQDQRNSLELRTDLDVTRVTDELRVAAFIYYRNERQKFIQDEGDIITNLSRYGVFSRVVKSINNHWSFGSFQSVRHSNFDNIDLSMSIGPAIEYSIFPYQEAIYKEFTIAYYTTVSHRGYLEETIYGETQETLLNHRLEIGLNLRKPWGSVRTRLRGRQFFHDLSKNSVEFDNNVNVRIIQGLAVRLNTNFEFINDQLSLPRGEVSLEDLLLAQRQLATNYQFSFSVGLNYTFGSIYNNIINTRL
jgi:hypothetical protein